jgi:hypothetical protein
MRKLSALILSFAVIYGITLIPTGSSEGTEKKTLTYKGINNEAMRALNQELANAKTKMKTSEIKVKSAEVVKTEIAGREKFLNTYHATFQWLKENQVLYRYQLSRSYEGVLKKLEMIETSEVEAFNDHVNSITNRHLGFAKTLKFSPEIIAEFQEKLAGFLNPLKINRTSSTVPGTTITKSREQYDFSKINKQLENLKENKTVVYEVHSKASPAQTIPMVLLYLAGLAVGVIGFATLTNNKSAESNEKSEIDTISGTMKRVLKELNYPVLICDSNFSISWQNNESEKMNLTPGMLHNLLSDTAAMESYEMNAKSYSVKVEELKYKSGKKSYLLQMVPQAISPRLLSNIVNSQDIEKVLERSLQESKDFRNLNEIVAENTVKMNYLFKVSAKLIDVDLDAELSECFIEANRLNDAVREFMMANYHLIKDDSKVTGMYLRTSEKGQRFNLNCFIPAINKDAFATGEASRIFVQKLSSLESKFNLYYPRVSFRWINDGEIKGVDICLSLENKSELESILRESNA